MDQPPPPSSTSPNLFTTNGGDIILRAGPEPDSKHDFRVHKVILSLASPVFEDMFGLPQPPDQNLSGEDQLPIVEVSDPPEVLDKLLRLIYPGVEPPKIADIPTLTALLSAADKYNITSIYPALRDTLKTLLRNYPFRAYVVACRFGFLEEAKEAAKVGKARDVIREGIDEEVRHISSVDLLRWVKFIQEREAEGRSILMDAFDWSEWCAQSSCDHEGDGDDFYFRLEKAVGDAITLNPCVESKDLFAVLDKVPDHPPGCKPPPHSAEFYRYGDDRGVFECPLQPMTIRNNLVGVADEFDALNRKLLEKIFGKEGGSS